MCWRALWSEAAAEVTPRGIDGRSRHAGYGGTSMRGWRRFLVATVGALSLVGAGSVSVSAHEGGSLIEFDSMTPVTGAAVAAVNDRLLKGGGLPWAISSGSGEVSRHGHAPVEVTGLGLAAAPNIGTNPIGTVPGTVSCPAPHGNLN